MKDSTTSVDAIPIVLRVRGILIQEDESLTRTGEDHLEVQLPLRIKEVCVIRSEDFVAAPEVGPAEKGS